MYSRCATENATYHNAMHATSPSILRMTTEKVASANLNFLI